MRVKKLNRKMMYIVAFILCIAIVNVGDVIISNAEANDMVVEYHGCTVNGWNSWVKQGAECKADDSTGLTRIELKVATEAGQPANSYVEYSVYSAAGWSVPVNGGEMASAAGQPIKAFNVSLKEGLASAYRVEYRACNNNNEWLSWASNGQVCGNTNGDAVLTAIQVKLVKTGTATIVGDTATEQTTLPPNQNQDAEVVQTTPAPTSGSETTTDINNNTQVTTGGTLPNGAPAPTLAPGATPEPDIITYPPTVAPEYTDEEVPSQNTTETIGTEEQVITGGITEDTTTITDDSAVPVTPEVSVEEPSGVEETIAANPDTSTNLPIVDTFVSKVSSQIGQGRNASGTTVYGEWWASRVGNSAFADAKWCAMFLSWCADQAGVAESTIGYYAACSHWQEGFKSKGAWVDKSGYTPVKGDIIFFNNDSDPESDHNGVVESVSGTQVVAIEGNVNDVVARVTYDINDASILGYGRPDYTNNEANIQKQQEEQAQEEATGAASGALADRLLQMAINEIGNREKSSGWTKYGEWYGKNIAKSGGFSCAHWCAMFVSWCADQAGVPTSVIEPYAYCPTGVSIFKNKGLYHNKSGYEPKKGDIIFFNRSNRADHTGIVEYVEGGYVHTVEGNTRDTVARRQYPLSDPGITGYGSPNY